MPSAAMAVIAPHEREVVAEAAELVERPRPRLVGDDTGDEEERGLEQGVVQDVERAGLGSASDW